MLVGDYLAFVLLLFLPGIALVDIARVGKDLMLVERLALALGIGISIDVTLILGWMGGLFPFGLLETIGAILAVSGAAVILTWVVRRSSTFVSRPGREDLEVIALLVLQAMLVFIHFAKYPIFPEFRSIDFQSNVILATNFAAHGIHPISSALLYYGVQSLQAALLVMTGGSPLIIVQRAMEILVVLSPLLVYGAAAAVLGNRGIATIAAFLYVGGGFIWFGAVFNAGLFANFYGMIATLTVIMAIAVLRVSKSAGAWILYLLALTGALFSHYSTLAILPAIVALPVLEMAFTRRLDKRLVGSAAAPILAAVAALALYPGIANTLLAVANAPPGNALPADTPLAASLAGLPFARYIADEITSDSATVFFLVMGALGAAFTFRRRNPMLWLPLVWFVSVAVASPFNESAWRYSFIALLPLCFLVAMGFEPLVQDRVPRAAIRRRKGGGRGLASKLDPRTLLTLGLLVLLVAGSWGTSSAIDGATATQTSSSIQHSIYASMVWFGQNTPKDSKLLSLTDYRFLYTSTVVGREVAYSPLLTPEEVLQQVAGKADVYVALTDLAALSNGTMSMSDFQDNPRFTLVYSNARVNLFSVNTTIPKV